MATTKSIEFSRGEIIKSIELQNNKQPKIGGGGVDQPKSENMNTTEKSLF